MFLTRAELFDLVWSHPRTTLAKRFNVSDVAVAKKCRSADIPMPPAGDWARIASGVSAGRPALPLRLLGDSHLIAIAEPRYGSPADTNDSELKAPSFAEAVDALV